jgi:hypothetical protein
MDNFFSTIFFLERVIHHEKAVFGESTAPPRGVVSKVPVLFKAQSLAV